MAFLIANALLFQIGWFVCLLLGDLWAIAFTSLALLAHFRFSPSRREDLLALFIALLLGVLHDSLLLALGHIQFVETIHWPPLWLVCIWALFGVTLNHSLRWIYQRFWLSSILGIIAGPLSYLAGVALSTAEWRTTHGEWVPLVACMWLLVLPIHRFIYLGLSNVFFIQSAKNS